MIRKATTNESATLADIWLQASIRAHDFVGRNFWEANKTAMQDEYIPSAETWVYESDEQPAGFYCLLENNLAALFVHPDRQGKGVGSRLLAHALKQRASLTLSVYTRNVRAINFYERHGFKPVETRLDEHTGCEELVMRFESGA